MANRTHAGRTLASVVIGSSIAGAALTAAAPSAFGGDWRDLNGDGVEDSVRMEPEEWGDLSRSLGQVRVISGATGVTLLHVLGGKKSDFFGKAATLIPDIDQDGVSDLAVAAPRVGAGTMTPGRVFLFSGRTGEPLVTLRGERGEQFGLFVEVIEEDGEPILRATFSRRSERGASLWERRQSLRRAHEFENRFLRPLRLRPASPMDRGDLTGDGVVNSEDLGALVSFFGGAVERGGPGDLDADGVVRPRDVRILIGLIAQDGQGASQSLLEPWFEGDCDGDGLPDAISNCCALDSLALCDDPPVDDGSPGGGGPGPSAGSHAVVISQDYPGDHGFTLSSWYPDNHMYTVTLQWPDLPPGHNTTLTANDGTHVINFSKEQWPGNHNYDVSAGWGTDPDDHSRSLSAQWKHAPNHSLTQSGTWDPPGTHEPQVSRTFPPDHSESNSSTRTPEQHRSSVSGTWHDASTSSNSHGIAFSAKWPTNHHLPHSPTWPGPTHHGAVSAAWPNNHISSASQTWPEGYPQWPPAHFGAASETYGEPAPPPGGWPVFPPDHSWWDTATDLP